MSTPSHTLIGRYDGLAANLARRYSTGLEVDVALSGLGIDCARLTFPDGTVRQDWWVVTIDRLIGGLGPPHIIDALAQLALAPVPEVTPPRPPPPGEAWQQCLEARVRTLDADRRVHCVGPKASTAVETSLEDFMAACLQRHTTLLEGAPGAGKSTVLFGIAGRCAPAVAGQPVCLPLELPALPDARRRAGGSASVGAVFAALIEASVRLVWPHGPDRDICVWLREKANVDGAVVLVDHPERHAEPVLAEWAEHLARLPRSRVVVAARQGTPWDGSITRAILQPLGPADRERMLASLPGGADSRVRWRGSGAGSPMWRAASRTPLGLRLAVSPPDWAGPNTLLSVTERRWRHTVARCTEWPGLARPLARQDLEVLAGEVCLELLLAGPDGLSDVWLTRFAARRIRKRLGADTATGLQVIQRLSGTIDVDGDRWSTCDPPLACYLAARALAGMSTLRRELSLARALGLVRAIGLPHQIDLDALTLVFSALERLPARPTGLGRVFHACAAELDLRSEMMSKHPALIGAIGDRPLLAPGRSGSVDVGALISTILHGPLARDEKVCALNVVKRYLVEFGRLAELVFVEAGRFALGLQPGTDDDSEQQAPPWLSWAPIGDGRFKKGPARDEPGLSANESQRGWVRIPEPFEMLRTPVCRALYRVVMYAATHRDTDGHRPAPLTDPLLPEAGISHQDADQFCLTLSQLSGVEVNVPSEDEWEYACRAGTRTRFWCGHSADDLVGAAWFVETCDGTRPVGQTRPNDWGLHDMHGLVAEQCRSVSPSEARVLRGGHHLSPADAVRCAARLPFDRGVTAGDWSGLRPVRRRRSRG